MSEKMYPIPFDSLMNWVTSEYAQCGDVFGVHKHYHASGKSLPIFGERIETPFGPAAGPNSQLAQNIIAAYAAGARFFEVKTVQKMDGAELAACVPRPCILAADEGYNQEWSTELTVQQALRDSVKAASEARRERIAVVGGKAGENATALVQRAEGLNSERVVLTAPVGEGGGAAVAAAVAGAIAAGTDPALPLNGAALYGIGGLQADYGDNDIDLMVRGGVTPLECVGGTVSPVRGITTRTKTGSAADATWRELTTVLVADDVIPAGRAALRSKYARAKDTAQGRGAIRAQTIVELEKKKSAQIIEDYGEVTVTASADDPTVCLVEFGFAVAHGLNQIYLTVHLTV